MTQSQEAAHALEQLERLRRRARADLRRLDAPLIVFGLLMLGSTAFASDSGLSVVRYWLVAAPAGILLNVWLSLRQRHTTGIAGSTFAGLAASVLIAVAAFTAASAAAAASSPLAAAVCPVLAIGVAYLVLAWLGRTPLLAVAGSGLLLLGLVVWLDGADARRAAVVLAAIGGASLVATGVAYWLTGRRSR